MRSWPYRLLFLAAYVVGVAAAAYIPLEPRIGVFWAAISASAAVLLLPIAFLVFLFTTTRPMTGSDTQEVSQEEVPSDVSHAEIATLADMRERAHSELRGNDATSGKDSRADLVDVSAFSPRAVKRGGDALVQVYLHDPAQAEFVSRRAKESDADSARRDSETLESLIHRGQRIDIHVDAAGAAIDVPLQRVVWQGRATARKFLLSVDDTVTIDILTVRVIVLVDGDPVGSLMFRMPVTSHVPPGEERVVIRGDRARHYARAFLSYASPDRAEVLKRAQALRAAGISFFQDLLSLEPGERWEKRLYQEIDRCDLFLLFWSKHAAESTWVNKEARLALDHRNNSIDGLPDIVPIILATPPPSPPDFLKEIQLDDWLPLVISAIEARHTPP